LIRFGSLIAVVALGVTATGCSSLFAPGPPAQFTNRPQLPACGQEMYGRGEGMDVDARTCLMSAFEDGSPAELVSTRLSVEGEPVVTYFRVWPAPGVPVEIYTDSSRDSFRSAAWTYQACERLQADVRKVFEVAGCDAESQVLVR
jgi:hypothetical protein